jgi:hypothetical protein
MALTNGPRTAMGNPNFPLQSLQRTFGKNFGTGLFNQMYPDLAPKRPNTNRTTRTNAMVSPSDTSTSGVSLERMTALGRRQLIAQANVGMRLS